MRPAGSASVEYVGIVCAIALLFASLLVLREVTVDRRAPIRPVDPIVRLLDLLRDPPSAQRPAGAPRGRPRTPPRPRPRLSVEVPRWF